MRGRSYHCFSRPPEATNEIPSLLHFLPRRGEKAPHKMPFARVGAMPQPNLNKQRNGQRKAGSTISTRQKGITIEDLKKQTALRLAQEQQQKHVFGYSGVDETGRERPLQPLLGHQLSCHGQFALPQANDFVNHQPRHHHYNGSRGLTIASPASFPSPVPYQVSHHPRSPQSLKCSNDNTQNLQLNHAGGYGYYVPPSCGGPPVEHPENRQQSPRTTQPLAPGRRQDFDAVPRSQNTPDASRAVSAQLQAADSIDNSSSHRVGGKGKQKLPHGLTVHELKAMTKARLEAEASEISVSAKQTEVSSDSRRLSPLDFDSVPEVRERAPSRDSGYNNNLLQHGPGSSNSIPLMVQVNSLSRDSPFGRQPQVSPLPAGFQTPGSAFHQNKVDAWESISVASHNSTVVSENFGSDSAYSGGVCSGYPQLGESDVYSHGTPFTEHKLVLALEEISHSSSAHPSPSNANLLFDATIGGNRRRAMTQSPRATSIHEDRPILHSDDLIMPSNFSSSNRGPLQSRVSPSYSPVLGLGLETSYVGQNAGLAPLGGTDLNRSRTLSATSLPLSTHGALDLNRDRANTFNGYSTGQPRADGLTDDISKALTESFLRVSHRTSEGTSNPTFLDRLSAPLGSNSNNVVMMGGSVNCVTAFSGSEPSFSNAWEEPTQRADVTGSSWLDAEALDDLTKTMGSILKLSGVGPDRPDRERSNTYPYSSFR